MKKYCIIRSLRSVFFFRDMFVVRAAMDCVIECALEGLAVVPERADEIGNGEQPLFTYGRESTLF